MARIRTIKPEFFTSEDIVSLSPLARLLYIAIWCEADKEGRLVWKPKTLKLRYFPADDCDIEELCGEIIGAGLVRLYGEGLAFVPGFAKHQHVNPRESASDLPVPSGVKDQGPRKVGKNLREEVFERDEHKCVRCGSDDHIQVDHILPQSCGGPHILENLRTLCRSCNAGRPVSGAALDDDLAKDGLTLKILRDKFGIDASIPELHAQGGREGKGKEGNSHASTTTRGSRLAADWQPTPDELRWARDARPDLELTAEVERFRDYWIAKPGKDGTKLDWTATWRNWIRSARASAGRPACAQPTDSPAAARPL